MSYEDLPSGSTFGLNRTRLEDMFKGIYNGTSRLLGLLVGGASNYFEIEADGTWVNHGDSTTWDDLVSSLIGRRLYSVVGTVDYDYDENSISFSPNGGIDDANDRLIFNYQYPHACIEDGEMRLHVHWEQASSDKIEFSVQYRIQDNGAAKTTAWSTAVTSNSTDDSAFTYVSGILNQITRLATIDMTGVGISSTVQFRFTKTDAIAGTILCTFVDAHVEKDTHGSRQEYVK